MISTKAAVLFKHFGPIKREVTRLRVKVYDNALTSNRKFISSHKHTKHTRTHTLSRLLVGRFYKSKKELGDLLRACASNFFQRASEVTSLQTSSFKCFSF